MNRSIYYEQLKFKTATVLIKNQKNDFLFN